MRIDDAPATGSPPKDRLVLEIDLNDPADREDLDLRRWPEATMLGTTAIPDREALERFAARELTRSLIADVRSLCRARRGERRRSRKRRARRPCPLRRRLPVSLPATGIGNR